MADAAADTIVILSSELISEITEQYFNKTMFKKQVRIVDLKPTENGYMFSVAFKEKVVGIDEAPKVTELMYSTAEVVVNPFDKEPVRGSNGKFVKRER